MNGIEMSPRTRRDFGTITKMRSGRYQASYTGPDGDRHLGPHTFTNRIDADGWLAGQRAAMVAQTWTSQTPLHPAVVAAKNEAIAAAAKVHEPTLHDYAMLWIQRRRRGGMPLAARTQGEYRGYVTRDLASINGLKLSDVTEDVVQDWFEQKQATGKIAMTEKVYSFLRTVFSSAVTDKNLPLIRINPCTVDSGSTIYTKQRKRDLKTNLRSALVTNEELARMVDAVEDRYRAAVLMGAWLGLRSGELRELRRKDITTVTAANGAIEMTIHVERAVSRTPLAEHDDIVGNLRAGQVLCEDGYFVGPTKWGSGARHVKVPPHIVDELLSHLDRYVGDSPEALLYTARTDARRHLSHSSFADAWYPARAAAGRSDVPFHGLRHFSATEFAVAGATLQELMERYGHSTVQAAMTYQQISTEREGELVAKMSARHTKQTERSELDDKQVITNQLTELMQKFLDQHKG